MVHKGCKKYLPCTCETEGFQADGIPAIKISFKGKFSGSQEGSCGRSLDSSGDKSYNDGRRKRKQWPEGLHDYLKFVMIKENVDTMTAVNAISRHLKINPRNIAFSGNKDKRAVTVQWCTIFRKRPFDVHRINNMKFPFIRVGDFEYCKEALRLGQLSGNRFEIILRSISGSVDEVLSSCAKLANSGFINYFGLQRFGRMDTQSHLMGLNIIKGNWKELLDMIFSPNCDKEPSVDWKNEYIQGNFKKAAKLIPKDYYIEKSIMERLAEHPADLMGAYNRSPKASRLICIHAYQSYIWNLAVSERLSRYGFECIEGDLVTELECFVDETDVTLGEPDDSRDVSSSKINSKLINDMVSVVKAEDVSKYNIRNVVLPLPGSSVKLPNNAMKEFYEELLAKDGLTLKSFGTNCHAQYNSSGTYRKVVEIPTEFEYKIIPYNDINAELADTELLKIRGGENHVAPREIINCDISDGYRYNALQLKFTLSSGSYATMLLRELTKNSTDTDFQSSLTKASRAMRTDEDNGDCETNEVLKKPKIEDSL